MREGGKDKKEEQNLLQKKRKEIQKQRGTVTKRNMPMYSKGVISSEDVDVEEEPFPMLAYSFFL
jgi:hypothetical protein